MKTRHKQLLKRMRHGIALGCINGVVTFLFIRFVMDNIVIGGFLVGFSILLLYLAFEIIWTPMQLMTPLRRMRFIGFSMKRGAILGGGCAVAAFALLHFFREDMILGGGAIGIVCILLYLASGDFQ